MLNLNNNLKINFNNYVIKDRK